MSSTLPGSRRPGRPAPGCPRIGRSLVAGALALVLAPRPPAGAAAADSGRALPPPVAVALRLESSRPRIDGNLDEPDWERAPVAAGFIQREPVQGAPATERTEARFLYDDEALYVGLRADDSVPGGVQARLTRRDRDSDSDWLYVELDPRHDRRSGYRFGVNAAGVKVDGALYLDGLEDRGWDAVWEVAVARTDCGWSAEMRIPFRILRFASDGPWGLDLTRIVARTGEIDSWSPHRHNETGWVSHFGTLEGLEAMAMPRGLGVAPYGLVRRILPAFSTPSTRVEAGADLHASLGGHAALSATINPDFGQVEADPAVLNLTVFETQFPERRPFFLDAATDFGTPIQLLFTRRIGAQPSTGDLAPGEVAVDLPESTRIPVALKLADQTRSGLRMALLDAVTTAVSGDVASQETGTVSRVLQRPTNYLAARIVQQLRHGSTIGLLATAVHRAGELPAWSGGADWDIRDADDAWHASGQLAISRATPAARRDNGTALRTELRRNLGVNGWGSLSARFETPTFDISPFGYQRRVDETHATASAGYSWSEPGRFTRQASVEADAWLQWSWDGLPLDQGASLSADAELPNRWWIGGGGSLKPSTLDDLDTRGGPVIVSPARNDLWFYLDTYSGRPVKVGVYGGYGRDEFGSSSTNGGVSLSLHPTPSVELKLGTDVSRAHDLAQWLDSRDEDGDGTSETIVFGELASWTFGLTLRANVTFTPELSLEVYAEPFVAVGDYGAIKKLARPRSYEFLPYALDYNPDFASESLNSNVVLRWEFAPGSVLFAIWNQTRADAAELGTAGIGRGLDLALRAPGDHSFAVKLSHQFDF